MELYSPMTDVVFAPFATVFACLTLCTCYPSQDGKTSLLCAAEAGHEKVVAYLLKFQTVLTELKNQREEVERASVSDIIRTCFYEYSLQ